MRKGTPLRTHSVACIRREGESQCFANSPKPGFRMTLSVIVQHPGEARGQDTDLDTKGGHQQGG